NAADGRSAQGVTHCCLCALRRCFAGGADDAGGRALAREQVHHGGVERVADVLAVLRVEELHRVGGLVECVLHLDGGRVGHDDLGGRVDGDGDECLGVGLL